MIGYGVLRQKRVKNGFDFNYFTHHIKDPQGELVVFCYELGYQQMDNDKITVRIDQTRFPWFAKRFFCSFAEVNCSLKYTYPERPRE